MEPKPFQDYQQLVDRLLERGMIIPDPNRALRKISQVGYYRLSGFWYPCRNVSTTPDGEPKRCNTFRTGTNFDCIFELYLFDKRLRLLLIDAIERIEVSLKTKLAHELGRYDPIAHVNSEFINPKQLKSYLHKGGTRNVWQDWLERQSSEIERCKEDYIVWHKKANKPIPIWVAIEAWSFGTVSKYFEMLKGSHQNKIAQQFGIANSSLMVRWLQAINTIRNRCAHHTRVWNQSERNPLKLPNDAGDDSLFFNQFGSFAEHECKRLFVLVLIIGYMVKKIGPSSNWLERIFHELSTLPMLPINMREVIGIPQSLQLDSFGI